MTDATSKKSRSVDPGRPTPGTSFPDKPFFSPRELSKYLDIPYATLAAWRCRGEGGPPWHRFGRHVRYRHDDVLAWIDQSRV